MLWIFTMDELPSYQIIRSNRRTFSMQILPDKTLLVKAPLFAFERDIKKFIEHNRDWIEKNLSKVQSIKVIKKQYVEGEKFLFLGKEYTLKFSDTLSITFQDNYLLFPKAAVFRIQKELQNFYIKQAKLILTQQLEKYAKEMKAIYGSVTFSDTKSQWGRCSRENDLQFNWRLVMAPLLAINYVIVHELAHTFEKNHSRSFWSKVRLYNPSYRQQIKWLKLYGRTLTV